MSVSRDNAVINESLDLISKLRYDRTGDLFDADSVTKVEIYDSDNTTILETIETANITKTATGTYKITTSSSWNTSSKTVYDRWYYVIDGVENILSASTFIRTSASPLTGMASYVAIVKEKLQEPDQPSGSKIFTDPTDYETAINEAVKEYSRRRPDETVDRITADGENYLVISGNLTNWENDFSQINNIEYPVSQYPPCYLETKWYRVELMDTGYWLRFIGGYTPSSGAEYLVRYTKEHLVNDAGTTIPVNDKDAVCSLATSFMCQRLASYYGKTSDSTLEADVVAYRTRGDEFASRGRDFLKEYNRQIKPIVTGVIGEWDMPAYWDESNNFLFHGLKSN